MSKNYMSLGPTARETIKKADEQKHAAARKEEQETRAFRAAIKPLLAKLCPERAPRSGRTAIVQICATDKGYAVHLSVNGAAKFLLRVKSGGAAWANALHGLIEALEQVPPGCDMIVVLNDPEIAAILNDGRLARYYQEDFINPVTNTPRANADLWRGIYDGLQNHRYAATSSKDAKSPRMRECQDLLKKATLHESVASRHN